MAASALASLLPRAPFEVALKRRALLRVSGVDTHDFLQGLFTNQLTELRPGGALYGCFLYFTGRVLCDAKLYQSRRLHEGRACVIVDTHADAAEPLQEHLEELVMRKKVTIENVSDDLAVVASYRPADGAAAAAGEATAASSNTEVFEDPWSGVLGGRLEKRVMPRSWVPAGLAHDQSGQEALDALLWLHGVGEGPAVFRHNKTLPFEGNIDFLGGVNFHKGCYIGQELTHRTHVMLVTRKRTVPVLLSAPPDAPAPAAPAERAPLLSAEGERIGELLCHSAPLAGGGGARCGLALLRLRYLDRETRTVPGMHLPDGTQVATWLPPWWPAKEIKKLLKNNNS